MKEIASLDEVRDVRNAVFSGFCSQKTLPIEYRLAQLTALKRFADENIIAITAALMADLHKPAYDAHAEVLSISSEIDYAMKNLRSWLEPELTSISPVLAPASSFIYRDPLGVCLIIGPFNYPVLLLTNPLIGAIAGGNTCVIKPSESTPHVEAVFRDLLPKYLDQDCYCVITGDASVVSNLLKCRWDKIFFTGSTRVGKIVLQAAAEHLTPCTLELGGKSPVIINRDIVDLEVVARRIVWGKALNCGQICVAPDYVFCHEKHYDRLLELMKKNITEFFGSEAHESPDIAHLVNSSQYQRVAKLLDSSREFVYCGGRVYPEKSFIEVTILANPPKDAAVMQEEIFGPLLPVFKYSDDSEVLDFCGRREKPLALYLFSSDEVWTKRMLAALPSGGAQVNDVIWQVANNQAPFGGVGHSGMGNYFGKFSFECFTHQRSVLVKSGAALWDKLLWRYPPIDFETMKKGLEITSKLPLIPPMARMFGSWVKPFLLGVAVTVIVKHFWK